MKIIHFTRHFLPRNGGVERHVFNIAQTQVNAGHKVTVVSGDFGERKLDKEALSFDTYYYPENRSPAMRFIWFLRHSILFRQADVIHFHSIYNADIIPGFLRKKNKCVATLHGWGGVFPIPEAEKNRIRYCVEQYVRKFIVVGDFVSKYYELFPSNVIYGAVDLAKFLNVKKNDEDFELCILGRIELDMGTDLVLAALEKYSLNRTKKLRIAVCGDGSMHEKFVNALSGFGFLVTPFGSISDPEEVLARSKVCITSGYLGILESLTLGLKVISVYQNALKKDYLKLSPFNEFILATNSPLDIEQYLVEIFEENKNEQGNSFNPSKFTWEAVCKTYDELYLTKSK
jgi:glycosyltransferase involved in cell wall biosynthesis